MDQLEDIEASAINFAAGWIARSRSTSSYCARRSLASFKNSRTSPLGTASPAVRSIANRGSGNAAKHRRINEAGIEELSTVCINRQSRDNASCGIMNGVLIRKELTGFDEVSLRHGHR